MYPFQKEGFAFALSKSGRCLIADEMGCGKTIQAIAVAYHYQKYWPLLIVTPSSLRLTWKSELMKWLPGCLSDCDINVISSSKDNVFEHTTSGHHGPASKLKPIASVTIVSYTVLTMKKSEFSNAHFDIIICDESHYLKNFKTQRCKVILPLIKSAQKVILLSGTPTNNRPMELFTQIDGLRPGEFMSFKDFTVRYCNGKKEKFGWTALGAVHLDELHALLTRRLKKDVLEQLPDKVRSVVVLEIDKKAVKALQVAIGRLDKQRERRMKTDNDMDRAEEDVVIDMKSNSENAPEMRSGADALKMLELKNENLMACFRDTGIVKIPGIKDYIADLFETGEKFLIFGHHIHVLNEIENKVSELAGTAYIRIDGDTKEIKRKEYVEKFQNDDKCRIAILSITAAGMGVTLTKATTVVFAELFWNPSVLLQCEDRAHRISQKEVVNVVFLVGRDTLDDRIFPMIHYKLQVISKTLSGKNMDLKVDSYTEPSQTNNCTYFNKRLSTRITWRVCSKYGEKKIDVDVFVIASFYTKKNNLVIALRIFHYFEILSSTLKKNNVFCKRKSGKSK
ncbi:DEXH-box helicase [Reticulomyxa filosa]|uniref:DEXH-box helicase n=1 Tax=Reticulomyxa filosa TaxID=46433 RepID=X6MYY3_RETFI|nr:DEXH-box helicase [Reticulomyxa filosa]|eukprot:ETO19016.1 DEXH-box helicase [Reticulomyxa filosa]